LINVINNKKKLKNYNMTICPLSKYSNIFGKPNTGLHQYRILDTAIVDYIGTIIIAMIITYFTDIPLVITTILSFVIGILLHILFGVATNSVKYLNLKC
jgi:hypothetical protein